MRGSPGEKIGEGATADIHAWAPGQVIKLFKASVPARVGRHEARVTRAVFSAGGPALEVFDEVIVEGRFGIVLPRLDGPTLLQLLRSRTLTLEQGGAVLAALNMSVHRTPPPAAVLSLRDWFEAASQLAGDVLPTHIATGVLTLIERLPPENGLCHSDLHAGNVIMTADGPRLIDWAATVRAAAGYDLARSLITLTELIPEGAHTERPRALSAAVQSEYARLVGKPPAALTAAMEPYLPVVRGVALTDRATNPVLRQRLIERIEATLRAEEADTK